VVRPGLANVHEPHQQVVYGCSPADVADVLVDGRLVDHDLAVLVEASRPLAADLVTRAGLGGFSRLVGRAGWSGPPGGRPAAPLPPAVPGGNVSREPPRRR
jgi:hypothetical protein